MSEPQSAAVMADALPWFRFYADLMSTAVIRTLSDYEVRVFLACMSLAGQSPATDRLDGYLTLNPTGEPLDTRFIHNEVWTGSETDLTDAISRLRSKLLLKQREDGALQVAFRWQQYRSDNATERVRRSRAKSRRPETPMPDCSLRVSEKATGDEESEKRQTTIKGHVPGNVSPCVWCGGTGRDADGNECPTCHGGGRAEL